MKHENKEIDVDVVMMTKKIQDLESSTKVKKGKRGGKRKSTRNYTNLIEDM